MVDEERPNFNPVHAVEAHEAEISAVKFNNRGDLLASCSWNPSIRLWSIKDDSFLFRSEMIGHKNGVSDIAFSCDDRQIASASDDRTVKLWDVATTRCIETFQGHSDYVFSLCFRNDLIFSGSDDKITKVWDRRNGKCVQNIYFHSDRVTSVDFKDSRVLTGSLDHTFAFHDIRTAKFLSFKVASDCVSYARFTGKGKHVAISTFDSNIKLWDTRNMKAVKAYEGHENSKYSIFSHNSPAGSFLASGSEDKLIFLWYSRNEDIAQVLEDQKDAVLCVQFHPKNETILVSGCLDKTMTLYKNNRMTDGVDI